MSTEPLLSLSLDAGYPGKPEVLRSLRLEIRCGEILCLAGQSGSGKSTLALAILKLLGVRGGRVRGSIRFQGRNLESLSESEMRQLRGKEIGFVPQSPLSSLNPALRVGSQLKEVWRAHGSGPISTSRLLELLETVSLPPEEAFLDRYPSEVSVGQGQRVLIAMAILHRPALIIADEPTSALDVITQSEILSLFRKLNRETGTAVLYISHDLLSVSALCHRIGILKEGELIECGPAEQIFQAPRHDYTRRLVEALPTPANA